MMSLMGISLQRGVPKATRNLAPGRRWHASSETNRPR